MFFPCSVIRDTKVEKKLVENLLLLIHCFVSWVVFQISAVRAVVPNKSNNEIVLVLQHFENCVDKAVQAFLEGKRM